MSNSPNLNLPYILPSQAQKHVTHNEAIRALDVLVQLSVSTQQLQNPPSEVENGNRFIVAEDGAAEWQGHDGEIAAFQDGSWSFLSPSDGWVCWVIDESKLLVFQVNKWMEVSENISSFSQAPERLGINAIADDNNRLSVSASNSLFNHEGGSHRMTINKNSADDTGSIIFQSGFAAFGEIGLLGDTDLRFKVTQDQAVWHDAMIIDSSSGHVSFPNTSISGVAAQPSSPSLLINSDMTINQRGFSGGQLEAGEYGFDRWKAGSSGADISVSETGITIASGSLLQVVEGFLFGLDNFANIVVTFTVQDLSGGDLIVRIGGSSAVTLSQGAEAVSTSIILGAEAVGNIAVEMEVVNSPVIFKCCKLETGTAFSGWNKRSFFEELNLCQRYFQKSYDLATAPGTATETNQILMRDVSPSAFKDGLTQALSIEMQSAPDVVWYSPQSGIANTLYGYGSVSSDKSVFVTLGAGSKSTGYPNLGAAFGGSNILWTAHYSLTAEL